MYDAPIKVFCTNTEHWSLEDEAVLQAVRKLGFLVDKDALTKALLYDRDQYDKGYRDARESLMSNGVRVMKWIPASEPPKVPGEYIVKIREGTAATTLLYSEMGDWCEMDYGEPVYFQVTHWMPMPELPEEGEV